MSQLIAEPKTICGPAYGWFHRIVSLAAAALLLVSVVFMWRSGKLSGGISQWGIWLAALVIVEWSAYWIWLSRVCVSDEEITQSWIWKKSVKQNEIASLNFVQIPFLDWLIVPRVVIRTTRTRLVTIPLASREVREFVKNKYPLPTGHL